MAVKKTTAKKSVAKKATARKSAPKKAAVKPKKAVAKKRVVKKSAVKKSAVKKSAVKKSAVKKTTAKKSAKKTAASKAPKKASARKSAEAIVIPEAPILAPRSARVEIVSTPAAPIAYVPPTPPLTPAIQSSAFTPPSEKKPGASGRVIFAVVVGIILLGLIVWAKGHNSSNKNAGPTASPTATATNTPAATPTPTDTSAALTAHEPPQGVVAHYTAKGATIFWKAPTATDGLTGYNVEISVSNGPWKLISTVPEAQLSLDVTKENSSGWTSFRVSSVYSDSQTAAAKAFGLPGTYS